MKSDSDKVFSNPHCQHNGAKQPLTQYHRRAGSNYFQGVCKDCTNIKARAKAAEKRAERASERAMESVKNRAGKAQSETELFNSMNTRWWNEKKYYGRRKSGNKRYRPLGASKYTCHQGKQECARRLRVGSAAW